MPKLTRTYGHESDRNSMEIATIFAAGILRLRQRGDLPTGPDKLSPKTALETARQDLEKSANPRLSVSRG